MSEQVIKLSDNAANRIKEIMSKADNSTIGVRVGVKSGGCAGMSYVMEYAKEPKKNEEIILDYSKLDGQLFYDVIYNPPKTKFLENAKKSGKKTENGKNMFVYQAMKAFEIWNSITPEINEEVLDLIK